MEKEEKKRDYRGHVMVVPYHGQGHMNPILQFCKRLSSKGIKITVATTVSVITSLQQPKQVLLGDSINLQPIYDDIVEGDMKTLGGFKIFLEKFQSIASKNLEKLIMKTQENPVEHPIKCLVYDANLPWCSDIAKEMSVLGAAFFTQSCSSIYSYYKMTLDDEEGDNGPDSSIPDLSKIGVPVLRSFEGTAASSGGKHPPFLKFILDQLSNIKEADWVLFNSFHHLEDEVVEWMSKMWRVKTIGPTIPSIYLDNRIQDDSEYGFNLFQPNEDACAGWLNSKEPGTVVYVSFGSAARLRPEQMEELAWGLKESESHFLWVVRESEESKLPVNFLQETSGDGLVVNWSPQLQALSHDAVGCFVTHCGWNSTIEGVCLGVPMVAMPQFLDQFSGAKFVEEVWRTGVRVEVDEKGIVGRQEIGRCIKEVMKGERSEEIKRNADRWKVLAKDAVCEGGSSDNNIEEIVARLVRH